MKITVRITVYKYEINVSSFSEVCFVVFTVFPANTILPAMYIYGNIIIQLFQSWLVLIYFPFVVPTPAMYIYGNVYYYLYVAISSFNSGQSSYNFLYMLFIYHMNQLLLLLNDICKWNADCQFQLYVREFSDYVHCSGMRKDKRETFRLLLSYDNESTCTRSTKNLKLIEESNFTSNYRTMYYCEYLPNTAAPLNDICQWNGNCQLQSFLVSGEKEGKV